MRQIESFSGYLMSFLSNHLSATFLNCSALFDLKLLQQANDARARRTSHLEETLHVVEVHLRVFFAFISVTLYFLREKSRLPVVHDMLH